MEKQAVTCPCGTRFTALPDFPEQTLCAVCTDRILAERMPSRALLALAAGGITWEGRVCLSK